MQGQHYVNLGFGLLRGGRQISVCYRVQSLLQEPMSRLIHRMGGVMRVQIIWFIVFFQGLSPQTSVFFHRHRLPFVVLQPEDDNIANHPLTLCYHMALTTRCHLLPPRRPLVHVIVAFSVCLASTPSWRGYHVAMCCCFAQIDNSASAKIYHYNTSPRSILRYNYLFFFQRKRSLEMIINKTSQYLP